MQSFNNQTQYLGRKSYHDLNSSSVPDWVISNQREHEQETQSQTPTAGTSPEKQPSQLGILILAIATITLYGFGINELSKTVTGIVETLVQEAVQD